MTSCGSFPALGMGMMTALLQSDGTSAECQDMLKRRSMASWARGPRCSRCSVQTPSVPGAFLHFIFFIWSNISCLVKGLQWSVRRPSQAQGVARAPFRADLTARSRARFRVCRLTPAYVRTNASALERSSATSWPRSPLTAWPGHASSTAPSIFRSSLVTRPSAAGLLSSVDAKLRKERRLASSSTSAAFLFFSFQSAWFSRDGSSWTALLAARRSSTACTSSSSSAHGCGSARAPRGMCFALAPQMAPLSAVASRSTESS